MNGYIRSGEMSPVHLPTGTVTFLLTDVEDSTRLWDENPEAMDEALARHDAIIAGEVEARGGVVHGPRGEGDSHFAVFTSAPAAVAAALGIQLALISERWPTRSPLRVRIGVHTGEAALRRGGSEINRCARIRALAGGGQTLLSEPAAALASADVPEGATLRDLGVYSLRGLTRPERVFQLIHADLPEHSPPVGSSVARSNLPRQLTSFIGRERETQDICAALASCHLVTLTGPGGTGKTRLALNVAGSVLEDFRDGVWFVDLTPLREPEHVPHALAGVLRITEETGLPLTATLAARLSDKKLLVVLDNCEHLIDPAAELLSELLRSCPDLKVLATSREPLTLSGETLWPVPPMASVSDGDKTADAVELFRDRAAQAMPHFELDQDGRAAVDTICRHVDGLPLGIEIAASMVRVLPVREIAGRLEQKLDLPPTGERGRDPRHRSLQAAVEWSYKLLKEDERAVFGRLSAFRGGCTLEAAEHVCAGDDIDRADILGILSRLVEKSLLAVGTGTAGLARYQQPETVRDFASCRLVESGESDATHDRHGRYFHRLAERASAERTSDQAGWLLRLREELDNLRAGLAWARSNDPDTGLAMVGALFGFWTDRALLSEGREWAETFLRSSQDETVIRARTLVALCGIAAWTADHDTVMWTAEEAMTILRRYEVLEWTASALNQVAWDLDMVGEREIARPLIEELVGLIDKVEDASLAAYMTATAGDFYRDEDPARSRALADDALTRFRESGTSAPSHIAEALAGATRAAILQRDFPAARACLADAFELRRELGDEYGTSNLLWFAALLATESGDPEGGMRIAGAASSLAELAGFGGPPPHFDVRDKLEPARAKLGPRAAKLWAEGRNMTADEAIAYALGSGDAPSRLVPGRALTKREFEVAEHIVEGLTNRQVAELLTLSERTVDAHVEHIRNKLGLRTRAQIAAWVTEERLTAN